MTGSAEGVLEQRVRFLPLGASSLRELLSFSLPLRESENALRQLALVEKHVRHPDLNAQSVVIEDHYIDRDFMEDHSAFYSKNLVPVSNFCKRIHFFNLSSEGVRTDYGKFAPAAVPRTT